LKRKLRLGIVSFIVGLFMVFTPTNAFAEQAIAEVTCGRNDGTEQTFSIGWDNSNRFFDGKGEIPRLFCEGGFAQSYNIYVRDNLPLDSLLRWYNGIAPILEPTPEVVVPTPEPTQTVEPEPVPSVVPSLDPEPTPIPEPTQSESPSPEPTVEPTPTPTVEVSPTPVVTPSVTPIAEPTPSPSEETVVPVPVEPTPTPEVEPTPSPSPTIEEIVPEITPEPQPTMAVPAPVSDTEKFLAEVSIQLPTYLENVPGIVQLAKAAESIMAIGSDMTPEEREESQGVVVAAVIVGQLAQVRRLK
jgi:hypothetical protein